MAKTLMIPLLALFWPSGLLAQLDLLTVREAASLLERVPAVAAATKEGECPSLSMIYGEEDTLDFQVRSNCGTTGGQLINNYTVNRRSGMVTSWGDNPLPVADRQGKEFARQLVLKAQQRVLSNREARCVALEAAKGLPGWNEPGLSVSVEPYGKVEDHRATYVGRLRSTARRVDIRHSLSVDLATARVRDDETGGDVMSEGLGALTAKIFALRAPLSLTESDALSIALKIPAVVEKLRDGCTLFSGGVFHSQQIGVRPACDGHWLEWTGLEIDLNTGHATEPDTGKDLDSAGSLALAHQVLGLIGQRRLDLQKEVGAACVE